MPYLPDVRRESKSSVYPRPPACPSLFAEVAAIPNRVVVTLMHALPL